MPGYASPAPPAAWMAATVLVGGVGVAAVVHRDRGALRGQQLADPAADAPAASRDQCDTSIESDPCDCSPLNIRLSRSMPTLTPCRRAAARAIIAAFFANLGIAISKFVGFLITGSAGLLAEALHSLADTGNQALLMFGSKRGSRPADRAHPFGYGPERYFWAFVVALVLFSMGGSVRPLRRHQQGPSSRTSSTTRSLRSSFSSSPSVSRPSRCARRSRRRTTSARLAWVGESSSAPASRRSCRWCCWRTSVPRSGLGLALFGLIHGRGDRRPQVGCRRLDRHRRACWFSLHSSSPGRRRGLLIGESASDIDLDMITVALSTSTNVVSIIHLRTMHLGPDDLLLAAKVDFDQSLSVERAGPRNRRRRARGAGRRAQDHDDLHRTRHSPAAVSVTGAGDPVRHARPIGLVAMVAVVVTFSASSTIVRKSGASGADHCLLADAVVECRVDRPDARQGRSIRDDAGVAPGAPHGRGAGRQHRALLHVCN